MYDQLKTFPHEPRLILEPGRAIVATSVVLVASVISRVERAGTTWVTLDAGVYNALYEGLIHQGRTHYLVHSAKSSDGSAPTREVNLAGPTGDSLDIVARNVRISDEIGVGDRFAFAHAGAYTKVMASAFNGFPVPPLFVLDD